MISIRALNLLNSKDDLDKMPEGKLLINTINAYSYNNARKDESFEEALMNCDVLLPDGISIVKACSFLHYTKTKPKERITGWDLFEYEMDKLNRMGTRSDGNMPRVVFMGASHRVLDLVVENASKIYPNLEVFTYSPPYRKEFTKKDTDKMVNFINDVDPDLLWIGMTAPKQEKWAYANWDRLKIHCHCGSIGAVFGFFAGTSRRAPKYWQNMGLEWLFRLCQEPTRLWRRYILGNANFIWLVLREKLNF